jgi:hypothetical protein
MQHTGAIMQMKYLYDDLFPNGKFNYRNFFTFLTTVELLMKNQEVSDYWKNMIHELSNSVDLVKIVGETRIEVIKQILGLLVLNPEATLTTKEYMTLISATLNLLSNEQIRDKNIYENLRNGVQRFLKNMPITEDMKNNGINKEFISMISKVLGTVASKTEDLDIMIKIIAQLQYDKNGNIIMTAEAVSSLIALCNSKNDLASSIASLVQSAVSFVTKQVSEIKKKRKKKAKKKIASSCQNNP